MKNIFSVIALIILVLSFGINSEVSAQEWKKLVPMVSTCKDVKKLLGVKKCEPRISDYEIPQYSLSIYIAGKDNPWKVPEGTVIQVYAKLAKMIKLEDYEKSHKDGLRGFREDSSSTLLNRILYTNDKKGIDLIIVTIDNCKWIEAIQLIPDEKRRYYDK